MARARSGGVILALIAFAAVLATATANCWRASGSAQGAGAAFLRCLRLRLRQLACERKLCRVRPEAERLLSPHATAAAPTSRAKVFSLRRAVARRVDGGEASGTAVLLRLFSTPRWTLLQLHALQGTVVAPIVAAVAIAAAAVAVV